MITQDRSYSLLSTARPLSFTGVCNRVGAWLCLATLCLGLTSAEAKEKAQPEEELPARPRVVIAPFDLIVNREKDFADDFATLLTTALRKSGRFSVKERGGLNDLLSTFKRDLRRDLERNTDQSLESSDVCPDLTENPILRSLLGSEHLFNGRVVSLSTPQPYRPGYGAVRGVTGMHAGRKVQQGTNSAQVEIDFCFYDSGTGQTIYSGTGVGLFDKYTQADGDDSWDDFTYGAIKDACKDIVRQLAGTGLFPIQGQVVGITDAGKYYVDLGTEVGAYRGMELEVYEVTVDRDIATKEVLGIVLSDEPVGTLVVDDATPEKSTCHLLSGIASKGQVVIVPKDHEPIS